MESGGYDATAARPVLGAEAPADAAAASCHDGPHVLRKRHAAILTRFGEQRGRDVGDGLFLDPLLEHADGGVELRVLSVEGHARKIVDDDVRIDAVPLDEPLA